MSVLSILALLYAIICLGVIGFQVALILGAPWGGITQGGAHEGKLPIANRIFAGVSILLLAGMALAVSSTAGLNALLPTWTIWPALGLQSVVTLLNWITRSTIERKLWAPITSVMLVLMVSVLVLA